MVNLLINQCTYVKLITLLLFVQNCFALYSKDKNIVELTTSNFNDLVIKGDEVWVVEFYAPWCIYCQNLVPEYTKAASILKGIIKVGAVNADDSRDLVAHYNIKGFPSIMIFGADKQHPEDYVDAKDAKNIMETAWKTAKAKMISRFDLNEQKLFSKQLNNDYVVELTDQNFDDIVLHSDSMWMVEFYAPWCGHCKNLQPQWSQAANELKDKVKFGALDSTVNQIHSSKYSISGYPSIKLFTPGLNPIDYNGGRSANDIITWVIEQYEEHLPAPKVHQIIDEKLLKDECENKQLAIITFLPNILDCQSTCRISYITVLKNLAGRLKKNNWCWLWSESNTQPNIEDIFKVGGSGYPALIAVSYNHKSYSNFVGAFTEDNIYKYLINLYAGKGIVNPIEAESFPIIFNIEEWDGKDKIIPEVDEKDEL